MMKKLFKVPTLLVLLMLMNQLIFPIGNVMVSANTMLPPSNISFQTVTPDDGKLTWSSVFGATGYKVYEIKEGQLVVMGTSSSTTYSLNNLPEGSYRYVVSTLNNEGESGPSAPISVEIVYPNMLAPANLTSTIQNGNDIVLKWDASQYADKYNVYQISETGEKTLLTSTTARSYSIVNSAEGSFTFTVSASHSLYGESPISEPARVEVLNPLMKQPSNLSFTISNGTDITLKWEASDYATNYKIYELKNGQQELKGTVTGTSYKFTNVPAGNYIYKVSSFSDRFGESAESTQVSVTVSSVTMEAPGNATYKIQNTNDVALSWGTVPFATAYKIYQVIDGQRILKSTVTGTSMTLTKLSGGNYEYEIYSYSDRFGESENGSNISFNIETVTVKPPSELSYKIENGNDIILSWETTENASNYKVYQIIDGQKVLKNTVAGTSVIFTNMPAGEYQFEVNTNNTRFGESKNAAQITFTLNPIILSAPSNASYEIKNGNDLILNWNPVEYATLYKIYQVIDGKKVLKTTVSAQTVTFTNHPQGSYQYQIHAYSPRFGESEKGTIVSNSIVYPVMKSPENVIETIKSPTSFTLSWDSVDYAAYYKVYQIKGDQKVFVGNIFGKTVTYNNMEPGSYKYEVYSYSTRYGESMEGAIIEVVLDGQVLPAPENLSYSIKNENDLTLKWDPVPYATSYNIYENIGGELVLKRTVSSAFTTFTNLPEGKFDLIVKSNSTLLGESLIGAEVEGSIEYPVMVMPVNLTNTISNGNDITLRWDLVTYANSYKIYQIVNGEKVFIRTVAGTSTTFVNMPEGEYNYEIHSYSDRFGESPEGSRADLAIVFPIMQAPGNLKETITNGNDIVLSWNSSSYATTYKIYQIVDGEKVLNRTVIGTSTTFVNMPEGDYTYEVHSYSDRFGESPEGNNIDFSLAFPIMQAPGNFTKTITNGNDIALRWNASSFAKEYRIYQVIDSERVLKRTVTTLANTFINMPEGDYHYVVHSYSDRFGESPVGSDLEFKLTWPIVQAPVIQGTVFNANNITLSWPAVTWANEYRVYKLNGDNKELIYKGPALSYKVYNLTEDTHSIEVTVYSNRFGESVPSNRLNQTVVYPIMGVPTATLKLLSETSARISWDFITYANGYNIYEIIDGKPVLLAEKVNNLSYTLQNLTYANHVYYVTSFSNSFGESVPSETVLAKLIVDTTAPETKIIGPTEWVNGDQVVELEATDDETGVAKTFYSLNDSVITEGTSISVTQEGINKVAFNSIDKVGNMEQVKTAFVKIDKTAPTTDINEIPSYSQSFTVQLTGQDELSGIAKTYYSINGSEFVEGTSVVVEEEGTNEISYYSVDEAGNKEEVKTTEIKIDKTAPTTSSDVTETWVQNDVTFTLSAVDEHSGVKRTYYSINGSEYVEGTSFVVEQEGINEITYYSVDDVGNKEEVKTAQVKIDKTAPTTSSDGPETWVQDDVTVTLTVADEHSGVAKTFYSINGTEYVEGTTVVVPNEGVNEISFYSVDAVGNKEEVKTAEVKIDKTAPATSSNEPVEWVNEDVLVTLAAADEHSGVSTTYHSINGSDYVEGTSFVVVNEGINEISYYSVDAVGNKEEVKTTKVKIDKTAPQTSHNAPEGWVKEDVPVTLTSSDGLSGAEQTYYSINGSEYTKGQSFTLTEEGIHEISFYSVDQAGNKEEKQVTTVKIDKTAPAVSMDVEKEYELGSTFNLDYLANDNLSGMDVEEVILNGKSYKKGDQISLDEPGEYKLVIKGTDVAGWTTIVEKSFVVYIPVTLEVLPKVIKENKGTFTVKATLPSEYQTSFDVSTVTLNGVSVVADNKGLVKQAEKGHFKFDREDFDWETGDVNLEFRGYLDNQYMVVGKTTVEVKGNKKDSFNWFEVIKYLIEEYGKKHN
jgi:large repetitive protein